MNLMASLVRMLTLVNILLLFIHNDLIFHADFQFIFLVMTAQVIHSVALNTDLSNLKIHNHYAHKIFYFQDIIA